MASIDNCVMNVLLRKGWTPISEDDKFFYLRTKEGEEIAKSRGYVENLWKVSVIRRPKFYDYLHLLVKKQSFTLYKT